LWSDHNFSFEPRHLFAAAERVRMGIENWQRNPPHHSLLDKQLIVLRTQPGKSGVTPPLPAASDTLQARREYIRSWDSVRARLDKATENCRRVFNFGASTWTWLLAAYCPAWWRSVECCLVDRFSGSCLGKRVAAVDEIRLDRNDAVVLGVNPASQDQVASRFGSTCRTIHWDDLVSR
jgi:hypothetical protein